MKALPFGQLAGQRMLRALRRVLASTSSLPRRTTADDDLTTQAPGYAIASAAPRKPVLPTLPLLTP